MSEIRCMVSSYQGKLSLQASDYRVKPGRSSRHEQFRHTPPHPTQKPRRVKRRRLRCDCGQLAVTVLQVRVGTDPQYTIRLPLCPACLALEQGFRREG